MPERIEQQISFSASPERVYRALTDARQFSEFTGGAAAEISTEAGGRFECFGGRIEGRHIELVPNRRVVQAWRVGNWDEGVYSIVRIDLDAQGEGTRLTFVHAGFPAEDGEHLEGGWHKMYWDPLREYLG